MIRKVLFLAGALLLVGAFHASSALAIPTIAPGYELTPFVTGLTQPTGLVLSPGGAYGEGLFVTEWGTGRILRVDLDTATTSVFAEGGQFANHRPTRMAFDTSGDFGGLMYAMDATSFGTDYIRMVSPTGVVFGLPIVTIGGTGHNGHAFGLGGGYGTNLFVPNATGGTYEVTPTGSMSLFTSVTALTLAFDPTTRYDGNLFAGATGGIVRVHEDGTSELFGAPLENLNTLVFDPFGGFAHDLFASAFTSRSLYRVLPSGDRELVMSNINMTDPVQANMGFAFDANDNLYYASNNDGTIYKITQAPAIPEPGTLALVGMGLGALAARARRRRSGLKP